MAKKRETILAERIIENVFKLYCLTNGETTEIRLKRDGFESLKYALWSYNHENMTSIRLHVDSMGVIKICGIEIKCEE